MWKRREPSVMELVLNTQDEAQARKAITEYLHEMVKSERVFLNNKYQVNVRLVRGTEVMPDLLHLSIKRIDKQPVHDWRDLQEIKNQIVGPECEGVELYQAESRRVDSANQYHVWCIPNPEARFPIGFQTRFVKEDTGISGAVQRKFEK